MASRRGAEALEELRIRFRQVGADRYLVLANGPASAADVIDWRPPFSYAEKLDELFSEAFGQTARSSASPIDSRLTELGRELFAALLPTRIRDCLEASKGIAEAEGCELRLRFDLPATLSDLPVEILCPPLDDKIGRALALNASLSVVRSVAVTQRTPRLPEPEDGWEPLSILVVVASPRGWQLLNVSAELDQLKDALMGFTASEGVVLEVLGGPDNDDRATLAELTNRVRGRGSPMAVLLIAHGETSPDHGQACVILEDDKGSAHRIPADRLAGTLGNSHRVRLVVLNLCVGAKVVSGEPLSGVAQAVISNRIPAVVGMSTAVTDEAASRFTAPLFRALCHNETIDEAVQSARHQMENIQADTRIEWCAPVLCMEDGCSRGQLFKVTSDDPDDPLRDGLEATKRLKENPALANLAPAAFFHRAMEDWERVRGLAVRGQENTRGKQYQALFKRLEHEASTELAIQQIDKLCLSLASDPPEAELALPALRGVPKPIVERLKVEVTRANERRRLHEHYTEGIEAESKKAWAAAVKQFEIFRERDYRDGRHRLAYATGQLAEDEGRWADARDAYAEIGDGLPNADVGRRLTYAQGRAAELGGEWSQAADAYAALRAGYRDHDQRLPYARGRSAEQAGDWSGAVSAFDLFTDTYLDVALRRGYAHARVLEVENAWTAVIEALAGLDAGFQDGDLGRLCSYAEARVAEEDGYWDRATKIYQTLGTGERDVAGRWPYATGRGAEAGARWDAAVEAYRQVPDDYLDAGVRLSYVTARHWEEAGQWEAAVHVYQAIPEHPHTAERLPYARACLAASTHDWNGVIEALAGPAQLAGDLREAAGLLGGYASGRVAEEAGHWVEATAAYRACGQYRDAPARAQYMEGRDLEDSADWTEALAAYEVVAHDLTDAHQAAGRLAELRDALPWMDGLPRRGLVEDPATPADLASPYQTLRVAGITPSSTAHEVKDASFILMASNLWTADV
ncbi:MAG: CHAT domain-containing protein, partial [Actinobacteria bacterium]|nr:CHAT domain-containing protein [Actinomycetota bacterium]